MPSQADSLNKRQRAFVDAYLEEPNNTRAALRAGYAESAAHVQGHRLITNDKVAAAIQREMDARAKRAQLTADYVLQGIKATTEACADPSSETWNPTAALKGYELLGKHMRLFGVEDKSPTTINVLINKPSGSVAIQQNGPHKPQEALPVSPHQLLASSKGNEADG